MGSGSDLKPYVDPWNTEGAALQGLRLVDRHDNPLNHPVAMLEAFGIETRRGRIPGMEACLDAARRAARLANVVDFLRWWRLAHELAHYVACLMGWPRPHHEPSIDDLAARIWIRPQAVHRAVGAVGWNPAALSGYFGEIPASIVFQRVATEAKGYAIGRDGAGRRFAFGPEGRSVPAAPTPWERTHIRIALEGASEPFLLGTTRGGEVGPFHDGATDGRGAVILFPEDSEYRR